MGRQRTLLGTVPILLRVDKRIRDALKEMAKEETKARGKQVAANTVAGRILADAVMRWKGKR